MTTISTAQLAALSPDVRFDAEFYQPNYLDEERRIRHMNPVELHQLAEVSDGNHLAISDQFSQIGVRYLRGQDLSQFFISDEDPVCIPESAYAGMPRSHMHAGDVLLSIVGSIGAVSLVTDRYPRLTGSCKIAILRPKAIRPAYLAAYLASTSGRHQVRRLVRGAVQTGVLLADLRRLLVPRVPDAIQADVEALVNRARTADEEADELVRTIERQLVQVLGMDDPQSFRVAPSYVNTFTAVTAMGRWDAEFFHPRYADVVSRVRRSAHRTYALAEILEPLRNGYDYRSFTSSGTPYLRVGDVQGGRIHIHRAARVSIRPSEVRKNVGLRPGDVVFTRKGTYGRAAVVRVGQEEAIISSEIILLRLTGAALKVVTPDYLAIFLNSQLGYLQVERAVHGLAFYSIAQSELERIIIPAIPMTLQMEMANLFAKSLEMRQGCASLLQQAFDTVDLHIQEADGSAARDR